MAEAVVRGAGAPGRLVRAVRRDARGVQQRRAAPRPLYFNQASPSAYLRGHTRAVPLALAYMRSLELLGARVLNGADVFALELSKSAQATLLRTLGIDCPHSITFNDVGALRGYAGDVRWPALLKPDQGGSGARIQVVESLAQVEEIFRRDPASGCRTISSCCRNSCRTTPIRASSASSFSAASSCTRCASRRHGRFNLCPSPVCNPDEGAGACASAGATSRRRGAGGVLPVSRRAAGRGRRRRSGSCRRPGSMSAASSIWKPTTAGESSTTSTPTRTCAHRWRPRLASIRSSGSSIFSSAKFEPFERPCT